MATPPSENVVTFEDTDPDRHFPTTMRIVSARGRIWIELETKHDGATVCNACCVPRDVFWYKLRQLPGLLP